MLSTWETSRDDHSLMSTWREMQQGFVAERGISLARVFLSLDLTSAAVVACSHDCGEAGQAPDAVVVHDTMKVSVHSHSLDEVVPTLPKTS